MGKHFTAKYTPNNYRVGSVLGFIGATLALENSILAFVFCTPYATNP